MTDYRLQILPYDFDDDIIEAVRAGQDARVKIYRPKSTMVVLGRGSRPALEIKREECEKDGVGIFKRHGGGCSVVLDSGNLVVSIAARAEGIGGNSRYFDLISKMLIEALRKIGIEGVSCDGISDLVLNGKKIAGSCIYRSKGLLFYSATFLIRPDLGLMEKYLNHPPREPEYRKGRKHSEFVTGLCEYGFCDADGIKERLSKILTEALISKTLHNKLRRTNRSV